MTRTVQLNNGAVDLHGDHSCLNYANNISNENMSVYISHNIGVGNKS